MSETLTRTGPNEATTSTEQVVAELKRRTHFVMVSHQKPDGDTLGAGLALGLALKQLGKHVWYFQEETVPRNLRFLPEAELVTRVLPADLPADTLFVFCDMSNPGRAGDSLPPPRRENTLDIDHHLGNERFGAFNYVVETECSTGTCVMRLLRELPVKVTPQIATCLLTTIMTDTGGFMHSNTTADVLRLSASLIEAGADKEQITEEIFANKRFEAQKLLGAVLTRAVLDDGGRYCWAVIDQKLIDDLSADYEDTEDIVNQLRAVEGVEVAALFKDFDGAVRVSLRSSGRVNVQAVASRLGGGGHFRASGLTYPGNIQEAIAGVHSALYAEGL
ncbi:MAG: bifunctional oligoribonuclease/PAP phosphatase NrnA [Candidatus Eremiobacteraeota bacterium]|nr:bifunctional oligoribonuclease/PAP phosphatase NrnA [Candidatus Eremiobacteraeota bacterium]